MIFFMVQYQISFTAEKRPNFFLSLIIIIFILKKSIQFIYPNEETYSSFGGGLLYVYPVLLSALGFFYVKYEIEIKRNILHDILKLFLLLIFVFYTASLMYKYKINDNYFLYYDGFLILLVVLFYVRDFNNCIGLINKHPSKTTLKKIIWYKIVFYGVLFYQLIVEIVEILYVYKVIESFSSRNFVLNIISVFFLLFYVIYALYNGYIFRIFDQYNEKVQKYKEHNDDISNASKTNDFELISEDRSLSIFNDFQQEVLINKLYLEEDIKIEDIAKLINVNSKYLSFAINKIAGKTFPDYLNTLRVEEVNNRLVDPKYKHLTIIAIANDCGFGSKSGFNRVYKKQTGMSPSEFQKLLSD